MMRSIMISFLTILILAMAAPAQDYGQTEFVPEGLTSPGSVDLAETGLTQLDNPPTPTVNSPQTPRSLDDWELILSDTMTVSIPANDHLAISFDPLSETLDFIDPTAVLTADQLAAIARAPAWLRFDLYDNFRRFEFSIIADWVAYIINNAEDPYVDEVCFQAAHISPQLLGGPMYLDLLTENAEWVYNVDDSLDFVEIVDYGTSADDDYYSTAVYRIIEENGDTVEIEIDKEIYYWYVVHPKLSDELPAYINPENGMQANPPTGVFWRSWFWTHADSGYAYYNEQWSDCDVLWDRSGGANDAIHVVNSWVDNVMNWGAGSERPIQPVRIYALHCGNCGEYQDIRAAAGRTALIPTACTSNICEDHVWNEFWEREWIHWDGGEINNPLLYENGWGKTLSAVFNWRGDGYVWTVTERYSADVCTLNVTVLDSASKPADGCRIKVYSDFIYGGTYYTTWGVTDANGQVSFILGDSKNFYLRLEGPLGNYPASQYATVNVIQNSQPGETYSYDYTFNNASPNLDIAEQQSYPNPLDEYRLEITYDLQFESIYGNFFTYQSTVPVEFTERRAEGYVDFFMLNEENFAAYDTTNSAEGFEIAWNSLSGVVDFVLPTNEPWYGVISNREVSVINPCLFVNVNVYRNAVPVVDPSQTDLPLDFRLDTPYPNPFNSETTISFALPHDDFVELQLFDVSGRLVSQLAASRFTAGEHQLSWNSSPSDASGIYVLKMDAGEKHFSQKLVLLK